MDLRLLHPDVDAELASFSKSLSPPKELIKKWNNEFHEFAQHFQRQLRMKYQYSIDRRVIGGSVKKNIAVCDPDYDIIMFFNDMEPPFDAVLDNMVCLLQKYGINEIRKTRYSVGFLFNNELWVDLLPATNMASKNLKLNSEEKIHNQKENVIEAMANLQPNERKWWSSSLSESQVLFMEGQSAFVHTVVKLARFWYKMLCCNEKMKVPGLKYLIELVAVSCAQQEEDSSDSQRRSQSVTQALAVLFIKLADTKNLAVMFENGSIVSRSRGRRVIKKRSGYVMDPANPFNDLLESVKAMAEVRRNAIAISKLEQYAKFAFFELQKYLRKYNHNFSSGFGCLDILYKPRVFETIGFKESYNFSLCFTYFANHAEYLKQMKYVNNPEEIEDDMALVERVFKVDVAVQSFKYSFTDESGNWCVNDSGDMQTTVLETMEDLQTGLIKSLEDHVDMQHSPRAQRVFHSWGAQYSGPAVRSYTNGRLSFTAKLNNIREDYNNVAVLHAPVWKGPCVVEGAECGFEVLYCCCLVVFD